MVKLTETTLSEQLHLSGYALIKRKELFRISEEDILLIRGAKETIFSQIDTIATTFLDHLTANPDTEGFIGDSGTLLLLHSRVMHYVLSIFDGIYDNDYVLSRLRVGLIHHRIGIEPKHYVSAVYALFDILHRTIARDGSACSPVISALDKVILFDISLIFDAYVNCLLGKINASKATLEEYARTLEEEVSRRVKELSELVRTDDLTGLANLRHLSAELPREIARSVRHGLPLTLAYLDLDNFKRLNDTRGHAEGDVLLKRFAEALRESLRLEDVSARIGGDEFCVLFGSTDREAAQAVITRLFTVFDARKGECDVTISAGLASLDLTYPQLPEVLINQADQAMYAAKRQPGHAIAVFAEPA